MTKTMKKITMMALVVMTMMVMLIAPVQAASKAKTTKVTLKAGQSKTLRVKTAGKVKWSSNNKAIVTVNKKGKIVARRAGKAKITAKYGKKKAVFVVTVKSSTPCMASSIRKESETMYRVDRTEWGADGSSSTSSYYYYSWSKVW